MRAVDGGNEVYSTLSPLGNMMSPAGNKRSLRNCVREKRIALGMTQEALGQSAGLTRQSIIAIESGRFTPSVHTALSLAASLATSVDALFWIHDGRKEKEAP